MKNPALALLGAAACVVLGLVAPLDDYLIKLLMQAATYAIAVLGLTIVLGYTGQISLAQAAFFGIGAYGVALGSTGLGLSFFAALALGTLLAGLFGVLLGGSTLKLGGHYLAMVTISFQEILTLVLTNWVGLTHGPDGVANIPRPTGLVAAPRYLALCLLVLFATAWAVGALKRRPLGLAMQAVRDNELAASVVGVNTYRVKIIAFALSALLGGLGGGLFAGAFRYISPDQFSFDDSVVLLTMALLGGVEAATGSVIGTALLVLLPEWLRFLRQFYLAVYGLAVILIMVFMPAGIWGFLAGLRPRRVAMPQPGGLVLGRAAGDGALLEVVGLAKHFGGLRAVDGVDLRVLAGEVQALIGPLRDELGRCRLVGTGGDGADRTDHADLCVARNRERGAKTGPDPPDHRDAKLRSEQGGRDRRRGVAGDDDHLDALVLDEVVADLEGKAAHLSRGPRPVGIAAAVPDVDEVLLGQQVDQRPCDGEPAKAAVKDPDRSVAFWCSELHLRRLRARSEVDDRASPLDDGLEIVGPCPSRQVLPSRVGRHEHDGARIEGRCTTKRPKTRRSRRYPCKDPQLGEAPRPDKGVSRANDGLTVEQLRAAAVEKDRRNVPVLETTQAIHVLSRRRLDRPDLDVGVLFLQITANSDQCAARTEPGHEVGDLGAVSPDLRPRPLVVRTRIGRVRVLVEKHPLRMLKAQSLRHPDGPVRAL